MVLEPMTRVSEGARLMGVPEMVTAEPAGVNDVPAMEKPVGSAVNVRPTTSKTD